jgi:hypothetical protein
MPSRTCVNDPGGAGRQKRDLAAALRVGLVGEACRLRLLDGPLQGPFQVGDGLAVAVHAQLVVPVHAVADRELAEDLLRVVVEVAVVEDRRLDLIRRRARLGRRLPGKGVRGQGVHPHRRVVLRPLRRPLDLTLAVAARCERLALVAAPEDQKVRHHRRARGALVRAGRQTDRADQLALLRHLHTGGLAAPAMAVHRQRRRHDRDQAATTGQVQGLEDEMVVDRVATLVVHQVGHLVPAEWHIADRRIEGAVGGAGVTERLVPDLGVRVEGLRDARGDRVDLDTGHVRAVGRVADEVADAGSGLQHTAGVEPEVGQGRPHLLHDLRVGVVRVQRVRARVGPLGIGQQLTQPLRERLELRIRLRLEDLGDRTPPGVPGEFLLLGPGRGTVLVLEAAQDLDGGDVRLGPVDRARRNESLPVGRGLVGRSSGLLLRRTERYGS